MATSRELVFKPADVRISIRCENEKCNGEAVISTVVDQKIPKKCPSCEVVWTEELQTTVADLRSALNGSEGYPLMLRVYEKVPEK